jgi:hypothetical protein
VNHPVKVNDSSGMVVFFSFIYGTGSVELLKENRSHHLMGKGHF